MLTALLSLNRSQKRIILLFADAVLVSIALAVAFVLLHGSFNDASYLTVYLSTLLFLVTVAVGASYLLMLSNAPMRANESSIASPASLLSALIVIASGVTFAAFGYRHLPELYVVFGLTYFLFVMIGRLALLSFVAFLYQSNEDMSWVLIYGAGAEGEQLAAALRACKTAQPVAFVDDNVTLQGLRISRLLVHSPMRIAELVAEERIDSVIFAAGTMSLSKQVRLASEFEAMGLTVLASPSFAHPIDEAPLQGKLTSTSAHALLGRDIIPEDTRPEHNCYEGRVILITGAGGSIGSELCRQILKLRPAKLVLFELNELALYSILQEMKFLSEGLPVRIVGVLGSVTESRQVRKVMLDHDVRVVLHAAAYKHVPLVEDNPLAGLVNNVLGTQTLVQQSVRKGVERFILISSDKAVRPTNVMGASKRLAEGIVHNVSIQVKDSSGPIFSTVRFGNVLGSSGSVVPLFQEQLSRGGPVTVTDPQVMRYFMTAQEAVKLVLESGSMARGGEVFVLDMGKPISILKLARRMIENRGHSVRDAANPQGDIEIKITGLRRGEKMVEELTLTGNLNPTRHPKIFVAHEINLSESEIRVALRRLREAFIASDEDMARRVAMHYVEPAEDETDVPDVTPKLA